MLISDTPRDKKEGGCCQDSCEDQNEENLANYVWGSDPTCSTPELSPIWLTTDVLWRSKVHCKGIKTRSGKTAPT